ncbi:hypothetical protein DES40_1885 [Litorimonas taeanensis]|uniref:Secreted protein n=1 Tax=Litorimonas taeanensis TaxID=568099 RepID=A0A420WDJ1_9PROT|nr:hypothetical protein [Litorimonas taeanensis]RKQ69104.1 hypothetical protein DES40_1885 [Litorimonas taeanensis]
MLNFKQLTLTALGALALSATTAVANDSVGFISSLNGDVLIERNGELLKAQMNSAVLPGDRITATNGANAAVNFAGCTSSVESQTSAVVALESGPCGAGLNFSVNGAPVLGAEAGAIASFSPAILLAGAGAIAVAAVALSDDDPSSP